MQCVLDLHRTSRGCHLPTADDKAASCPARAETSSAPAWAGAAEGRWRSRGFVVPRAKRETGDATHAIEGAAPKGCATARPGFRTVIAMPELGALPLPELAVQPTRLRLAGPGLR